MWLGESSWMRTGEQRGAARSSGGRDGGLKSWTAAPSMSSKRRDLRVGSDFKLLVYFVFLFHIYFLQVFAWPPFENNNLLLSDRPSATFCPFSAPFEEFLTNLEEALVVLRAWLLKLVLTDSAGKMWTAFSVALGSSSGQWLSEGSTRDHWSDLEEHVFLRKQHNN